MVALNTKSRRCAQAILAKYIVLRKEDAPTVLPGIQVTDGDLKEVIADTLEAAGE